MANDISYDDSQLRHLFRELDPANRKKLFRSAFRKTGNKVKKVAQQNVRSSTLHNADQLTRGVRVVTFRRDAGFRVTVAGRGSTMRNPKRALSMHMNRRGLKKPVLQWAEPGTANRYTRGTCHVRLKTDNRGRRRKKKVYDPHLYRGRMPRYGFMAKTQSQVEGKVEVELQKEITLAVERLAKKYGIK